MTPLTLGGNIHLLRAIEQLANTGVSSLRNQFNTMEQIKPNQWKIPNTLIIAYKAAKSGVSLLYHRFSPMRWPSQRILY